MIQFFLDQKTRQDGHSEAQKSATQGVVIRQKKAWRRREGVFVYFEEMGPQGG